MAKTRSDWHQKKTQVMGGFVILLIAIGTILNSRIAYFFIMLNTENNENQDTPRFEIPQM